MFCSTAFALTFAFAAQLNAVVNAFCVNVAPALTGRKGPLSTTSAFASETNFKVEDLKQGDIVSWSTGDSALDKIVARFSKDEISHSAIIYDPPSTCIEQAGGECRPHNFFEDPTRSDRTVTVIRFKDIDVNSVISGAEEQLDVPYSFIGLGYLAVLLILNDPSVLFPPSPKIKLAIIAFMAYVIDRHLRNKETNESTFCSQFVYKAFSDAGIELKIRDPVVLRPDSFSAPQETILESVIERVSMTKDLQEPMRARAWVLPTSIEEAASNLLKAIEGNDPDIDYVASAKDDTLDEDLMSVVVEFALAVEGNNLPEGISYKEKVSMALRSLAKKDLVTPGELTRIANDNAELLGSFVNPFVNP
mmetsp:Transcript_38447/g.80900  ORF Transcript_38447/g.80900 Transcript_38447/m.80900 type:complete len:362 (-) Transcript_38447:9-1094(-)